MRMQTHKNNTVDFGAWRESVGRGQWIRDYKLRAVFTAKVMGEPKSHKSPQKDLLM